jgi:hypothetical protein
LYSPIALGFICNLWQGNGIKKATSSSLLVLNAKGGEVKAKATRSINTCEFFKNLTVSILGFLSKPSYCKNYSLVGGI